MSALSLPDISLGAAYRLRLKRRACLWRAFRARHRLSLVADNTAQIRPEDILVFCVLRNERQRLPYFLEHYRDLGAGHFLVVDNGSDDGSLAYLQEEARRGDLSIWETPESYRDSRFGLDWSGWLLMRFGHRHWCLTVDADELLVYPGMEQHPLPALTDHLDKTGQDGFGTMMLDMFPKGALDQPRYEAGQDPTEVLGWFDAGPYRAVRQAPLGNLWLQGGTRERVFFQQAPERAPTLNKIPLIRWNRRYAYTNSTHALLPRQMNMLYDGPGGSQPSGVLLHTKFLPEVVQKSAEDQQRGAHFHTPALFYGYYSELKKAPDLWHSGALRYEGPEQLAELGLCAPVPWV
ncbi:glycosyltransferase family 2 protein [Phaeobacter sp. HF9A]|uniref:glycosyltransferase family 2 protein n=1 Tax=Phaeobacter sp. HF9A TaxID=2721561 RepID=UPI00143132BD|nr:glycosyltransferase family 2 protein [Phaeobacter sp. HF9A]NIZ12193.1 glycosyltransferase family 2 protein [Phaeobacter sp. HF9A]